MAEKLNKDWGQLDGQDLTYAPVDISYGDITYSPAEDGVYKLTGWKRIVRSVHPDKEIDDRLKWIKLLDQDDETIFYVWKTARMTDSEYLLHCHEMLNDSDWTTTAYMEDALDEEEWIKWKSKRKVWRDFIRSHE